MSETDDAIKRLPIFKDKRTEKLIRSVLDRRPLLIAQLKRMADDLDQCDKAVKKSLTS